MKVLVCFKVTPDYEALRPADWQRVAAGSDETKFVHRVLNVFDESALELALRLRDAVRQAAAGAGRAAESGAADGDVRLRALTIGGHDADPFLQTLLALGYDAVARVPANGALDFAPQLTASVIAAYARRTESDLLLLGDRSGPGDSGLVPFLVAESLGWSCLSGVTELRASAEGALRLTWAAGEGQQRATLRGSAVLAVGNAVVSCLRVPTLADRLKTRDLAIDLVQLEDLGVHRQDVVASSGLVGLEVVDRRRAGVILDGRPPATLARTLLDDYLAPLLETS